MAQPTATKLRRVLHAEQATFGTAEATSVATNFYSTEPVDITFDVNSRQGGQVTGALVRDVKDYRTDTHGSMATISESGVVFNNFIPRLLYAVMQNVTEGGDGVNNTHAFTFPTASQSPDFSANEGYFETIFFTDALPDISQDVNFKDCIMSELGLSVEPRGELMFNATWTTRNSSGSAHIGYTGTATRYPATSGSMTYNYELIKEKTASINGATAFSLDLVGPLNINIVNPVAGSGLDGSGNVENYLLAGSDFMGGTVTATIRNTDNARKFKQIWLDSNNGQNSTNRVKLLFRWANLFGTANPNGNLLFTVNSVVSNFTHDNSAEENSCTVEFTMCNTTDGVPLTVNTNTTLDAGW